MIGNAVVPDTIELNRGDFAAERVSDRGALPPGTIVEIIWATGQVWPAEVIGDTAYWHVENEDHADIPDGTAFVVMVRYPTSDPARFVDHEWRAGVCYRPHTL